jgi:hypothetical protein
MNALLASMGGMAFVLFLAVGITHMALGYMGIEHYWGTGAAVTALIAAVMFRFMLPLTIGTFFGAMAVLKWPWYLALLVAAPGLLFAVPALVAAALASISSKD